jgi:arylsulfatase A
VPNDSIPIIYTEMIETMDEGIGDIMQTLITEGLDEHTIVVFCSDNGAAARRGDNGVLRSYKASLYEGGHRVPAIIRYPGKISDGSTITTTVMSMDLLPTLVDFAGGVPTDKIIDGISISSLLLTGAQLQDRDLFWSFKNQKAMRRGKWKLVSTTKEDKVIHELFNLENDLSEKDDLSADHPQISNDMQKAMENWHRDARRGVATVAK